MASTKGRVKSVRRSACDEEEAWSRREASNRETGADEPGHRGQGSTFVSWSRTTPTASVCATPRHQPS